MENLLCPLYNAANTQIYVGVARPKERAVGKRRRLNVKYGRNRHRPQSETVMVTMNMLLEFLDTIGYTVVSHPAQNAKFDRTIEATPYYEMIEPQCVAPEALGPKSTILYLCDSHSIKHAKALCLSPALLLLKKSETDIQPYVESMPESMKGRLAIVRAPHENHTIESLHNHVLHHLLSVHELTEDLVLASGSHGTYQKLIDIGEDHFGCFMNVTDANYVLLAHTLHIAPRDEINASLVAEGYHAEMYLNRQRSTGYLLESIADQKGVRVYPPEPPFPYDLITAVMHVGHQYVGQVLMACDEAEITPGTVDTFALFASYCERLARRQSDMLPMRDSPTQALLLHLIAKGDIDGIFLREQAEQLNMPVSGTFVLAFLEYGPTFRDQLNYFATNIDRSIEVPHIVFPLEGSIGVLLYGKSEAALWDALIHTRQAHPGDVMPRIYVSDAFYKLSGVHYGFRQIESIKKYERDIRLCLSTTGNDGRTDILSFRDAFCFYWDDTLADEKIRHFSLSHLIVNVMTRKGNKKTAEDLVLLFTYLANERKATLVGAMCHLHRNGVLYRIEKLEEEYGFDLNDYLTRQYVQVSIRIKLATSQEFSQLFEDARTRLLEPRIQREGRP